MNEREKFEKWAERNLQTLKRDEYGDYVNIATGILWTGWQAALSTRKPYGYGIVDKDGKPEGDGDTDKEVVEGITEFLNESYKEDAPYRVVELFYEDSES